MQVKQFNEEVLYADAQIVKVGFDDISLLKKQAVNNKRQRIRLCTHKDIDDTLHEMLIIHKEGTYVRPHKHLNKSESFHIIEGSVDIVMWDDDGKIIDVIRMSEYSSGSIFYYRISNPYYHTLFIRSEFLVFHEITNGPFRKADTVFAPWSPDENNNAVKIMFLEKLESAIEEYFSLRGNERRSNR